MLKGNPPAKLTTDDYSDISEYFKSVSFKIWLIDITIDQNFITKFIGLHQLHLFYCTWKLYMQCMSVALI